MTPCTTKQRPGNAPKKRNLLHGKMSGLSEFASCTKSGLATIQPTMAWRGATGHPNQPHSTGPFGKPCNLFKQLNGIVQSCFAAQERPHHASRWPMLSQHRVSSVHPPSGIWSHVKATGTPSVCCLCKSDPFSHKRTHNMELWPVIGRKQMQGTLPAPAAQQAHRHAPLASKWALAACTA